MDNATKYSYIEYSHMFPELFRREKYRLKQIVTKDAQVQHVGSTAVPSLGGKGILDIFVSVSKKYLSENRDRLQRAGYVFKKGAGSDQRQFFEKDYLYARNMRRVHVHLAYHKSPEFTRAVSLVEYLKKHPEAVREYSRLKRKAVDYSKGVGRKYREFKRRFLEHLSKRALTECCRKHSSFDAV